MLRWDEHHHFLDFAVRELGKSVVVVLMKADRFESWHRALGKRQKAGPAFADQPLLKELDVLQLFVLCHYSNK